MSSESLHVPRETLSQKGRLLHYAITSLKEELDAVDWYRQRADDTEDEALKAVLLHNMREEIEHASMILEWLRRNDEDFSRDFDTYLYSEGPITAVEVAAEHGGAGAPVAPAARGGPASGADRGFTVGRLKGE
ncbi:MAG: ferritin [Stellaceae bacterium]